jgi:hypothetical protein
MADFALNPIICDEKPLIFIIFIENEHGKFQFTVILAEHKAYSLICKSYQPAFY